MNETTVRAWGALWRQTNESMDGACERLLGVFAFERHIPRHMAVYRVAVFRTRREAYEAINERYGYIRTRPDLQGPPHGWRMPIPVRVKVNVSVATEPVLEMAL